MMSDPSSIEEKREPVDCPISSTQYEYDVLIVDPMSPEPICTTSVGVCQFAMVNFALFEWKLAKGSV